MATCPGSLIVHRDGTVAGCTNNEATAASVAICGMRVPVACTDWFDGCDYCGVH
jgi:hypothetical protein